MTMTTIERGLSRGNGEEPNVRTTTRHLGPFPRPVPVEEGVGGWAAGETTHGHVNYPNDGLANLEGNTRGQRLHN